MKIKITFILIVISIMAGTQSCCTTCNPEPTHSSKSTINSNTFDFKVINLTVDSGKLNANGGVEVTHNWTVNITINGETTTFSGSNKSNELPVMAGDILEVQFQSSCEEETEAVFTMPDETTHTATEKSPAFTWTVPDNFFPGMQIKGESHYETETCIYNKTGIITLVGLKSFVEED